VIKSVLAATLFASALGAQAPTPPTPCAQDPNFRQFDFWVGEWEVTPKQLPAGAPKPKSRVEKILNDCVIFENWLPPQGAGGKSFNIYNRTTKKWEQTWVDGSGSVVHFSGEVRDGNMYYTTEGPGPNGQTRRGKMTFFRISADSVRQLWEASTDDGKTWTTAFDGMYVRKPASP
jgi:hypothetical protein